MPISKKHKPSFKIWLEHEGKPILGEGGASILEQIQRDESIFEAARELGMSYRYVWNYIQKIEKAIGEQVLDTFKGGKHGGGGARLTTLGEDLLEEYKCARDRLERAMAKIDRS